LSHGDYDEQAVPFAHQERLSRFLTTADSVERFQPDTRILDSLIELASKGVQIHVDK
jgi:hypothetical protein